MRCLNTLAGRALLGAAFTAWAAVSSPALAAQGGPACAAKRADIEAQIGAAQARGNRQELAGLKRALKANQSRCSDAGLARERDARIREAQREVAQRETELAQEEKKGDAQKIAKRSAKLDEARAELAEASKPLLP